MHYRDECIGTDAGAQGDVLPQRWSFLHRSGLPDQTSAEEDGAVSRLRTTSCRGTKVPPAVFFTARRMPHPEEPDPHYRVSDTKTFLTPGSFSTTGTLCNTFCWRPWTRSVKTTLTLPLPDRVNAVNFSHLAALAATIRCRAYLLRTFIFLQLIPHKYISRSCSELYCVSKNVPTFELSATLSNLNRFSICLHCWKAYEKCPRSRTQFRQTSLPR